MNSKKSAGNRQRRLEFKLEPILPDLRCPDATWIAGSWDLFQPSHCKSGLQECYVNIFTHWVGIGSLRCLKKHMAPRFLLTSVAGNVLHAIIHLDIVRRRERTGLWSIIHNQCRIGGMLNVRGFGTDSRRECMCCASDNGIFGRIHRAKIIICPWWRRRRGSDTLIDVK